MSASPPAGAFIARGAVPEEPGARRQRLVNLALAGLAAIGGLAGLYVLWLHLTTDPFADARAYYDAAARLNAGQPLYPAGADADAAAFFRYPPLLAIVLRPFALLPYQAFSLAWEAVLVAALAATIRRLGGGRWTWIALGLLGIPIGWAIGAGQAQVLVTYLVALGQPWSIALGGQLKLFPVLVAIWWLGRRDWQAFGAFVAWSVLLVVAQVLVAPAGFGAFLALLNPGQIGEVRNISPYVLSPWLWAGLVVAGTAAAAVLAPTRRGWPAAVALATLASPRLLVYMLTGLLAAVREPDRPGGATHPGGPERGRSEPDRAPDAAEAYVGSAR